MSSLSKILRVCNYFLVVLIGLSSLQCQKEPIDQELYIIYTPTDASNDVEKKYGFINNRGEVIIEPQYDSASSIFSEGLAWVKIGDKYGCIDKSGEMVIEPFKCEFPQNFSEGLAAVSLDGKWGYIDKTGEIIIPPKFNSAYQFSEGLAPVSVDGEKGYIQRIINNGGMVYSPSPFSKCKYGYIDKTGDMVISPKFTAAGFFKGNFTLVKIDSIQNNRMIYHTFLIDKTGKTLFEDYTFSGYYPFSEGLISIRKDNKWGFMDKTGEVVIEPKYKDASYFSDGLAPIHIDKGGVNGQWNYIDKTGKIVIDLNIMPGKGLPPYYSEGFARVLIDYEICFIDTTGKIVFKVPDGNPNSFSDGMVLIKIHNRYGYLDKKGTMIIEPKFDYASDFKNGLAYVNIDGRDAYINNSGEYVWPPNFTETERILDRSTPRSIAELYAESIVKYDFRLFGRISADTTEIKYLTNKFGKGSEIVKDAKMNYQDLTRQFNNARGRIYFFYRESTGHYEGNIFPENLKYHIEERDSEQEEWGVVYEFNFVLDEVLKSKVIRIYMAKDSNNEWKCFKDNI